MAATPDTKLTTPPPTPSTDVGSLPISAFYQDPDIDDARLSPSGHYLAMTKKLNASPPWSSTTWWAARARRS